jgi:hypothetical protein
LKWYFNLYSEYLCESKFEENSQYRLGQAIWILLFTFFWLVNFYCDVKVTQINYPSLNKQDNIEQAKGRSHKKYLVQVFMLDDLKFEVFWGYLDYTMINKIK